MGLSLLGFGNAWIGAMPNTLGVPMNLAEDYFWMDLAANTWNGARQQEAVQARDLIAQRLTQTDLLNAQNRAAKWLADRHK